MTETTPKTATDQDGTVHTLAGRYTTVCGQRAARWSTAVTELQQLGLVMFCAACGDVPRT